VLQLGEEPLDQVSLAVEPLAEAQPDREALRIDDDVDLGREPPRDRPTMIWTPFLPSQPAGAPGWKCCRSSVSRRRALR
jgi:hypothetical protein